MRRAGGFFLRIKLLSRQMNFLHALWKVVSSRLQLVRNPKRWGELAEVLLPAQGKRPRKREQVAAVCYRLRKLKIEFLLVRTRKGRWTFPKGGVVRGLSRAQSAALEAFEEAGVHGRIELASFARYTLRKRNGSESEAETTTHAHLCEVLRLSAPEESNRNPTWFSAEKSQLRLSEGRSPQDAAELARVVARAVTRIERLSTPNGNGSDAIRKVQFESCVTEPARLIARVALFPYLRQGDAESAPIIELDPDSRKTLRLQPGRASRRVPK